MEGSVKFWIATLLWLYCTSVIVESRATCSDLEVPNLRNYTIDSPAFSLTIDVPKRDPKPYQTFLKNLRDKLKCSVSHGIPVLCPPDGADKVIQKKHLFFVDLSIKNGNSITLAFKKFELYLVGLKTNKGAHIFKDAYQKLKDKNIFDGVKNPPQELGFDSSYASLADREKVPLGMLALRDAINVLYAFEGKDIKKNLVVVIQMISEAARFSIIERYVNRFDQKVLPLNSHLSYENSWGKLSDAIQNSNTQDGKFEKPVTLKNFEGYGKDREVKSVAQVRPDIGIIKLKNPKTKLYGEYVATEIAEELFSAM